MIVEEDGVADDGALGEHAELAEPGDRRHAMAARDLVELDDRLRRMRLPGQVAGFRFGEGVAEQAFGASVDLSRDHHAGEAA